MHGGGDCGGDGGDGGSSGGYGTTTPHSWTASICSLPDFDVVTRIVFDCTLPSNDTFSDEPHAVEHVWDDATRGFRASAVDGV